MIGEIWAEGLNRLGDWNPQAFREIKGRLTPRNLGLVVGGSFLLQSLLLLVFVLMLPNGEDTRAFSTYCVPERPGGLLCQVPIQIRWDFWWRQIAVTLSWLLPYAIAVPSVAFIAGNFAQEVQRGTLNVLRLSPQRPRSLLQGKLWGVPSPIWLGALTVLPLYLWAAMQGGIPLSFLLSYGITWGLAIGVMNTAAALISLNLENQADKLHPQTGTGVAIGAAALAWTMGVPLVFGLGLALLWSDNGVLTASWRSHVIWFGWSLTEKTWLGHLWVWGWLIGLGRGLHQAAVARMGNPLAPIPTKQGSYVLTVALALLIGGFFPAPPKLRPEFLYHIPFWLGAVGLFFTATGCLQKRQTLLDWLRYRHLGGDRRPLWQDLLWGDRSPWVGCLALNAALYLCLWLGLALQEPTALGKVLALGFSLLLSAIAWSALMQTLRLWARREIQMTLIGMLILAFPSLVVVGTWSLRPVVWPLWLILGHTWVLLDGDSPALGTVVGILGQTLVSAGILGWSIRIWQQQGASEWQRLAARVTAPTLSTSPEKPHVGELG
jgi:hypothetical protein